MEAQAREVVERLAAHGHTAYYAGGCVRDQLMGIPPEDYDIATSARPESVTELFPRSVLVGAQFGVVRVLHGGHQFEIATFRSDGAYIDGRRPDAVTFSTPEEDARRRDFTINGMFHDPVTNRTIDHVGGKRDLNDGVIRCIGNPADRFHEDHLRLLRAVRFSARFDFPIETLTLNALKAAVDSIAGVSPERVRDELTRMLLHHSRARALDLLLETGLLRRILPEVADTVGCEQPPQFHPEGDVYTHTRIMLELLPATVNTPLAFGTLLHDIGKPPTFQYDQIDNRIRFNGHDRVGAEMTREIMRRLRFPNDVIERTVEIVRHHMEFKDVRNMRKATLKRFMNRETFDEELELHRVDCESSHGLLDNYDYLLEKRGEFASEPLIPPPLVNGHDLIAMGLPPSPEIGRILHEIQTRQLEGTLDSRDKALQAARELTATTPKPPHPPS